MIEYKKAIKDLTSKLPITEDEIFDYEFSPFKEEFDQIFKFYRETLDRNAHYGIVPSFLYFTNDRSVNAAAGKYNDIYITYINMGTVVFLISRFREKRDLLRNGENNDFVKFESRLDTTINELMYQEALHFTFYHEMGHLVQNSKELETKIFERVESVNGSFFLRRHVLELDADQFSALFIGGHVVQYALSMFGEKMSKDEMIRLLVIFCSSSFFYFLSFNTNNQNIYYEESTHPHPIIRITCVVFHIVGYCTQSLEKKGIDLNIDPKEVINRTLDFSKEICESPEQESLINNYLEVIGVEAVNIQNYLKKTRALSSSDRSLASYKWNQYATMIGNN